MFAGGRTHGCPVEENCMMMQKRGSNRAFFMWEIVICVMLLVPFCVPQMLRWRILFGRVRLQRMWHYTP